MKFLLELGSPIGRPPHAVLPYGTVIEDPTAFDDSDEEAAVSLNEDSVAPVSPPCHITPPVPTFLSCWALPLLWTIRQ